MTEKEVPFRPELARPERYSLERTTIEALTSEKEMPGRMKKFPWPLELQGKGSTNEEEKSVLIRFPKGDIFLSFATTIHELGHLRQEELNPTLKKERQTHENLLAQEQDAWDRGWQRFLKSNPDIATSLEGKFQDYRRQGKMNFPELTLGVSTQRKLRLSSVLLSLPLDVLLYHLLVNTNGGGKISI